MQLIWKMNLTMHAFTVSLIRFGLAVTVPLTAAAFEAQLLFNGVPYQSAAGEVHLPPGVVNTLSLAISSEKGTAENLVVRVRRVLPDRRAFAEEKTANGSAQPIPFDLGPLSAPPVFEYEAGMVYQRGYQLSVAIHDDRNRTRRKWEFGQTLSSEATEGRLGMGQVDPPVKHLRFVAGAPRRSVFNPRFGALAPFTLRLKKDVLVDQNELEIQVRLNRGDVPESINALLSVASPRGEELWRRDVHLESAGEWRTFRVSPEHWPAGKYRIDLKPFLGGGHWPDGPFLTYRRRPPDEHAVAVSALAPWSLRRDPSREEIFVEDLRKAHERWGVGSVNTEEWGWRDFGPGRVALVEKGDRDTEPLTFRFPTNGHYAVFADVQVSGLYLQVGQKGLIRGVMPTRLGKENFIAAADLSANVIRVYPGSHPKHWIDTVNYQHIRGNLSSLRLVPVTRASVEAFHRELSNPPNPLFALADWVVYFDTTWARLQPDQFQTLVCAQAELGLRTVGWGVGRSWVEYHSKLPHATLFPAVPFEEARKRFHFSPMDYRRMIFMVNQYDALEKASAARQECGAEIWPWLAMQRHYGVKAYGGIFAGKFYRDHPQWWRTGKNGEDTIGLSYFFPEVRSERIDILTEVAERGTDGLLVGVDRQVPMLLYNPAMVQAYRDKTGVDPLKIDASHEGAYLAWIRWRADFLTQLLRDLKKRLAPIRANTGKQISVTVRVPSAGLFHNLAQGLDVERWCKEKLVDQLQLIPLEDLGGAGEHDVRPYLALGRRWGVSIVGGIGSTVLGVGGGQAWHHRTVPVVRDPKNPSAQARPRRNPENLENIGPGMRRALGLLRAGVDGLTVFETEMLSFADPLRYTVALYGHPEKLERFLNESNLEACYPIDAGNAAAGFDNHSRWTSRWSVYGFGRWSL